MAFVVDQLGVLDLERRFVDCADPVEGRGMQAIWLLAQGHTVGATSKVTAFGSRWIEQVLGRYNASGPDNASGPGALANGHRRNGPKPPRPAETLWPLVDEPSVNKVVPSPDDLVSTVGARCCSLAEPQTDISSRTNFARRPKNYAPS